MTLSCPSPLLLSSSKPFSLWYTRPTVGSVIPITETGRPLTTPTAAAYTHAADAARCGICRMPGPAVRKWALIRRRGDDIWVEIELYWRFLCGSLCFVLRVHGRSILLYRRIDNNSRAHFSLMAARSVKIEFAVAGNNPSEAVCNPEAPEKIRGQGLGNLDGGLRMKVDLGVPVAREEFTFGGGEHAQ